MLLETKKYLRMINKNTRTIKTALITLYFLRKLKHAS